MAFDSSESEAAGRPPISRHPGFPAVVALWFAALLGLGSLILPVILLERVIEETGLAAMLPAARPPLGFTARFLIAGLGALLGAGLGAALARRVMQAQGHTAPFAAPSASARRPISAHDELGDEGLGAEVAGGPRRRSLAMAEDARSDDYAWLAPLPGDDFSGAGATPLANFPGEADEPLELSELADDNEPAPARFVRPEPASEPEPSEQVPIHHQDPMMTDGVPAQFPTAEERERRRDERRMVTPGSGPAGIERRLFLRRGGDEPLPFTAPSLGRRAPADNENMPADEAEPAGEGIAPFCPEPADTAAPEVAPALAPPDWSVAPLDSLGMVQLVERLAASLEMRRSQLSAATIPAPLQPAVPDDFQAAPPEQAAQAMAAYFGRPPASPPADAVWLDRHADDDFDWADSFARSTPRKPAPAVHAELAGEEEDLGEDLAHDEQAEYGSLLNLAGDPPRKFDPPGGPGPVQPAAPSAPPEGTDEALRKAIATLQRISSHG